MESRWCILALLFMWMTANVESFRTCAEARLCCPERNNTCFAFGPRIDGNVEEQRCFCDENCKKSNDCCRDYSETCRAIDCEVGKWQLWGECDNECGIGKQKRRRKIIQQSQNGGKGCPILHQKRVCTRNDCLQQSVEYQREEIEEIGQILPAQYGLFRDSKEYNPLKDIRKNLFERFEDNAVPTRVAYCGKFVITSTRESCNQTVETWAQQLQKGAKVCVECQPMAMASNLGNRCRGHGVFNEITRWNAINVPNCHGEWIMTSKHESCTCNLHGDSDYILV